MGRVLILVPVLALSAAGCGECGRRLFFFTTVEDSAGAPVQQATVTIECRDARRGTTLSQSATTDAAGEAAPAVHALNDECPADPDPHVAYFEDCTLTVTAEGFATATRPLSGAELDALPVESGGAAGHGVRVAVTLAAP